MSELVQKLQDLGFRKVCFSIKERSKDIDFEGDHYNVTLLRNNENMEFEYTKGFGHKGKPPTLDEVVWCLYTNYDVLNLTFEEFCIEYGYDYGYDKNNKNKNLYKVCKTQALQLKELLQGLDLTILDELLEGY